MKIELGLIGILIELYSLPEVDSIIIHLLGFIIQFDFYTIKTWTWEWEFLYKKYYQALSICTPTFGFDIRWYR